MPEEIVTNNLEDAPPLPPAPVADTPPPAAELAPTDEEPDPEGTVDVGGQKMVSLDVVKAIRKDAKAVKDKAAVADQLYTYVAQVKPYIDLLQQNPQLLSRVPQSETPPPAKAEDDPAVIELARTMDLYTTDGQPDVARAAKLRTLVRTEAEAIAAESVKPLRDQTAKEKSASNFQRALLVKSADGRSPDKDTLAAMWREMPVDYTSDERVAATLAYSAIGYDVVHGKGGKPVVPQAPPLVTEAGAGRISAKPALTELDQRMAAARGIKPETYAAHTEGFKAGVANVLEDE